MPAINTASVPVHYELSGAVDGEPLVLTNSLGSRMRMWDQVLPAFEKKFRVLRNDMRGHGQSSAPPGPYSIDLLAGDLLALLDKLGLDRVHLCGLSLGGLVAMWLGIHAPHRMRRIVLANTAARIGTWEGWEQRIAAVRASGMAPLALASLDRWFTPGYREQHPAEMESIQAMIASTNAESYAACCGVLRDVDLSAELRAIAAPCLVITGTHDSATPPADGKALHAALSRSTYVELDASHLSAWERHDEFARAVLSFLERDEVSHG